MQLQRGKDGILTMITTDTSGVVTKVKLKHEYGVNDFDFVSRKAEIVQCSSNGPFGLIPKTSADAINIVTQNDAAKSRRRRAVTAVTNTTTQTPQGILSPIVCVTVGQVVLFKINLHEINRSLSNYPRYSKNHLFNSNPNFDYGQFRQLHLLLQTTNLTINVFANVFSEPGVHVFYDNAEYRQETIIVVPKLGSSCPGRMDAAAPIILTKFNIGPLAVSFYL